MNELDYLETVEIYQMLSQGSFKIKPEVCKHFKEMEDAKEQLKQDYMEVRSMLRDGKISKDEIIKFEDLVNIKILNSLDSSWEKSYSKINKLISSEDGLFKEVKYLATTGTSIFALFSPDYVIETKASIADLKVKERIMHYLDGKIFASLLDNVQDIINFANSDFNNNIGHSGEEPIELRKYIQLVGFIGIRIAPYVLIASSDDIDDPNHPVSPKSSFWKLNKEIKKFLIFDPSSELIKLTSEAAVGLRKFLKGKKVRDNQISMYSFWGAKKGINEIQKFFNYLEELFNFEDKFIFTIG